MLQTLRFFPLQNAVYFIMLPFWFLYYSHFIYRMCSNLKENSGSKGLKKVIPKYAKIKFGNSSPAALATTKKAQITRIKD